MRNRIRGVTLIELMIVIVVVAILASVAVPSYRRYMMRTNRTEATAALLQLRTAQEKFFLQNSRYADNAEVTTAPAPGVPGLGIMSPTEHGYYTVGLAGGATATSYTAVATAAGGQTQDTACATITITDSGVRGSAPDAPTTCWK